MATNPTVEKLKVLGLRHGEKIAMGVVAAIFVTCAYFAATHKTIELTPDQVDKAAKDALANIRRPQSEADVTGKLDALGVKVADFEKVVDVRQNTTVDASKYSLAASIFSPEPGAGLIRDMPEFLAPEELYVYANRGAVKVFDLDENGEFKLKPEPKNAPPRKKKPTKRGGMPGMGGARGGAAAKAKKSAAAKKREAEEARKRAEEDAKRVRKGLAGNEDLAAADKKEEAEELPSDDPDAYMQSNTGLRMITVVGKFDHKRQRDLYAKALKLDLAAANPHYLRLDVERQEQQSDGGWSDWEPVDRKLVQDFTKYRRTTQEEELVPQEARIDDLVDPLPYFEVGYWVGAHHIDLVPKEVLEAKTPAKGPGNGPLGAGPLGGAPIGATGYGGAKGPTGPLGGAMGAQPLGGGGLLGAGGGRRIGPGASEDFQKTNADWIMIRALDMNVQPDATYRYRVRIYFENPNWHVDEALLTPGTNSQSKEMHGPWSKPTAPASVPADVSTYALKKAFAGPGLESRDPIQFQVAKWNPDDGYLFVKNYDQAPGQIIGDVANMSVPSDKPDKGPVAKSVDFDSHQILADALGGDRPTSDLQDMGTVRFETPAMAIVMRSDGTLVLRDQSRDASNGEMADQKEIFERFKHDLMPGKKKKKGNSSLGLGPGMTGGTGYGGPAGPRGAMGAAGGRR